MTIQTLFSTYNKALPSSGGATAWPANGEDIASANATTLEFRGTTYTLNTFDGITHSQYGASSVVVTSAIRLRLELWGAGGGGSDSSSPSYGSAAGYICGDLVLSPGTYWLIVGQGGRGQSGATAYPDGAIGATGYSGGASGGGGSTRFGPNSSLVNNTAPATDSGLNATSAEYYLIAPGGGGGTDYGSSTSARGGYGAGGGFSNGPGRHYYSGGESADSCGTGAGQSYGGQTGTSGRRPAGSAGVKYQGGTGTGGGGGGGYYGGGGARGYYSQGGGGSAYFDPDYVRRVYCIAGAIHGGVQNNYWEAPCGLRGKPVSSMGNGGLNDGSNGGEGGARLSLWVP